MNHPVGKVAGPSGAGSAPVSTVGNGTPSPVMKANLVTPPALYCGMISLSRQAIMSSAHRWKNCVVSTMRNRGLRCSVSAANSAIVSLACASVASLVAGSHLSSRVFHWSWWMITPYSVLATSVDISLVLSLIGSGHANRPRPSGVTRPRSRLSDGADRGRLVGVHPEPGPGLHQPLQPGADKLGPRAGHGPGQLGVHHADRPERELQQGAGAGVGQVEGGHADAYAHVE